MEASGLWKREVGCCVIFLLGFEGINTYSRENSSRIWWKRHIYTCVKNLVNNSIKFKKKPWNLSKHYSLRHYEPQEETPLLEGYQVLVIMNTLTSAMMSPHCERLPQGTLYRETQPCWTSHIGICGTERKLQVAQKMHQYYFYGSEQKNKTGM